MKKIKTEVERWLDDNINFAKSTIYSLKKLEDQFQDKVLITYTEGYLDALLNFQKYFGGSDE